MRGPLVYIEGQHDDAGKQLDASGSCGQIAEQHERLVEWMSVGVACRSTRGAVGVGAEHVVLGNEVVVAELLHDDRKIPDGRGIVADLGSWKYGTYAHF